MAPMAFGKGKEPVRMLTTDVALIKDKKYEKHVNNYAKNPIKLDSAFAASWYKLTSRDMGPVERCLGPMVLPAQPWQFPLPPVNRGERLLQTPTLIGQDIQLSSSCPIRARQLHLLSNQSMCL